MMTVIAQPFVDAISPLIDIGVNLTDARFAEDRADVIQRAFDIGIEQMILTGTSLSCSTDALNLVQDYPERLFSTAGCHPHHASEWNAEYEEALARLWADPACVAVGEAGLDFNRNFSSPHQQRDAFEAQLAQAAAHQLPMFIHERDAGETLAAMIRPWRDQIPDLVVHCFTGSREDLYRYLDLDLYIGLTGWICDERRGTHLQPLIQEIPEYRLMLETDAPYLMPRTQRPRPPKGRNEPACLPWVLAQLAHWSQRDPVEWARLTTDNARRFFRLPS